ncbi:MAG: hypothetical protein LDLANPLL_00703 [Turneriella sp.]|nr:hypothetical protein [Turneriella sp.]
MQTQKYNRLRKLLLLPLLFTLTPLIACGRAKALAEEGVIRLEQGKQTSALELFDRALRSDPKEPLALFGKGILLSEEQITEEIARAMLIQAAQQEALPEKFRAQAYLRIAELAATHNERDTVLQNLAKISAASPAVDKNVVRRMTTLYLQLKEKNRAREILTLYRENHKAESEVDYTLFRLYALDLKDFKAAAKLCAKVNWKEKVPEKYGLNCARIFAAVNDFPAALELIDGYIARKGNATEKQVSELRENIVRKRGKFEPNEADF